MLEFYTNLNINNGIMARHCGESTMVNSIIECNGGQDVGSIKCEQKNYDICEGCGMKILDKYVMRVAETSWHEQCLACCCCRIQLTHTCFTRNMKLYCKDDYYRVYGMKCSSNCSRCCERIQPNELVMKVPPHAYHLHCFVCCICNKPLQKGEHFSIKSGQLICQHDLEKDYYLSHSHYADDDLLLDDVIRPRDGRRGPKRPRTILTSVQRRQFKASFDVSPKPCRKVREALAKDTNLSVRVVQVWFQNQRAKMKKISRKSKNGEKPDDKDDKSIKQESPNSEHGHYLGMDGSFSSSSQPLNPNLPFSPDDYPGNSADSMCSSDVSLDGSNFDNFDEGTSDTLSLQNLDVQPNGPNNNGLEHNNNNNHSNNNGSVTHIDKLYLMQNSYFSAIEQ